MEATRPGVGYAHSLAFALTFMPTQTKPMKKHLLFYLLFTCAACLHAAPIDVETARATALRTLQKHGRLSRANAHLSLVQHTEATYLFANTMGDFALVASDDRLPELIAYGSGGGGQMPPALEAYLHTIRHNATATTYRSYSADKETPVAPLLPFVRHQEAPYNAYCPYYIHADSTVSTERCVVGCVATAMEEAMSYYRRTITLRDTLHGWETDHYIIDDVLPGETIDCRLIAGNYDTDRYTPEQADAVARLSYYCGMAVKMNWGLNESGASIRRMVEPLQRVFGFAYARHLDSYKYAPSDWLGIMKAEIRAGRPVLYAGYTMNMSGHAFVLDGLDEDGFFHVNWGYGGDYDGYFRLDLLTFVEPKHDTTTSSTGIGFYCNQEAVLMHPDIADVALPDTLVRTGREIVVDSVSLLLPPEVGKKTPIVMHLHNTAEHALTTPFALFTNAPTDTAYVEQGDYIAITGITLQAGERCSWPVHVQFDQGGTRTLRITPDDTTLVYEQAIDILPKQPVSLRFDTPQVRFPQPNQVEASIGVSNTAESGRSGQTLAFELYEGEYDDDKQGTRHYQFLYLQPGEQTTLSSSFLGLQPGATYTLLVRSPWVVVQRITFQLPEASAIEAIPSDETVGQWIWYDSAGRRVMRPTVPGVYLRHNGRSVEKVLWP